MSWLIASQIVQDNATGLRFEFDEGAPGDNVHWLRVFTKERTRVLVLMFQRDGALIKSDVRGVRDGQLEDVGQAAFQELHQDPAVADAAARSSADLMAHGEPGDFAVKQADGSGGFVTADELEAMKNDVAAADARQADELTADELTADEKVKYEAAKQRGQGVYYNE